MEFAATAFADQRAELGSSRSPAAIPIRALSKRNYVEKLVSVFVIRGLFVFAFVVYQPDSI